MDLNNSEKPRKMFTDGMNSLAHFSFGGLSTRYPFVLPAFVLYQLAEGGVNTFVDISEFMMGYIVFILARN